MLSLGLNAKIKCETFPFGFSGFPLIHDDFLDVDFSAQSLTICEG
jgi:hypothetical protein